VEGADPGPAPLTEPADEAEPPHWAEVEPPDWDDEPSESDETLDDIASPVVAPEPATEPVVEPVVESEPVDVVEPVLPPVEPAAVELAPSELAPLELAAPARSSGVLLPIALGLVLIVLLGAVGWLAMDAHDRRARDDRRQAALQAARQEAVNLTTISYQTADADLGRIIAAATGTLKTQFQAQRAQFPAVLARDKSVSVGTVLAAGVASQSASTVEALVAVDASVSNAASEKSGPVVKHYRMDMKLVRVGGHWLVSQVAFAGLPQ
jgi:Mce-associated membrane protein